MLALPAIVGRAASTSSPSPTFKTLYIFRGSQGADGAIPESGLLDVGGTLYGTTTEGGTGGGGTVFKVTRTGTIFRMGGRARCLEEARRLGKLRFARENAFVRAFTACSDPVALVPVEP